MTAWYYGALLYNGVCTNESKKTGKSFYLNNEFYAYSLILSGKTVMKEFLTIGYRNLKKGML